MTTLGISIRQLNRTDEAPVWDLVVRVFHWSLVAAIAAAAATGFLADASWIDVHVWAGTAAAGLVSLRIVWGFLGTTHARFAGFVAGPTAIVAHLRRLRLGTAERHRGHNPLGAAMVLLLLLTIIAIAATGVIVFGGKLKAGPLAFMTSFSTGRTAGEVHELLALFLLGLVALHVTGAIFESRRTRENLVRAMIDGRKEARATDPLPERRQAHPLQSTSILAVFFLAAAGAVWSLAAKPGLGVPAGALDPTYVKECAACHVAYHPSLLPRASWAELMAGLDDHFGENASLDSATAAGIAGYLEDNATEAYDTKPANMLRRVTADKPFTITSAPFWIRTHAAIPDSVFAAKAVGLRGNCEACHGDARSGRFYPGAIDIPQETKP